MSALQAKADKIAQDLSHLSPMRAVVAPDNSTIMIVFTIMNDESHPWLKSVEVDAMLGTAEMVSKMLEGWTAKVLMDIADDNPSPVVQAAFQKWGHDKVMKRLLRGIRH